MTEVDAINALIIFVSGACEQSHADRIVALLGSPRGHKKFLGMLAHKFTVRQGTMIPFQDASLVPAGPCYIFTDHGRFAFGESSPSFAEALDRINSMGAWLLVSASGHVGIYQSEDMIDHRIAIGVS